VGIQLDELVALPVGCNVEGGKCFGATHHEGTTNDGVVGLAVHAGAAEEVFAGCFEAGEETAWEDISGLFSWGWRGVGRR
jgi:hypothetical protein